MKPLHIRLMISDGQRDDVTTLREALQSAGHVVVDADVSGVPPGVSPAPDFVISEGAALPVPESLESAEARHIRAVLGFTGGNKRQAALLLGIARSTLLAKVRRYGIR